MSDEETPGVLRYSAADRANVQSIDLATRAEPGDTLRALTGLRYADAL